MHSPFQPIPKIRSINRQAEPQAVPAKTQTLKEWSMAGGGVPTQYKGREHVWHAMVDKFAAGGAVQPAALIDGNDFAKAAQANGLKTDNATLNKIVARVNKGESVQEAAKNVAQSRADGGEVHMVGGGDPLDEFSPPRYRSAGRRPESQNDRRAAANMPMDLARGVVSGIGGAPGDIESLVRMLPGLDEKTVLPTSEDIEKRLPFKSDTPAGRAASGLGILAGGFYGGPGAPIRLVGGLPQAVYKAGKDFGRAAGQPAANVVKPTGGNFLTGRTKKDLQSLKAKGPTEVDREWLINHAKQNPEAAQTGLEAIPKNEALNNWIDSNLTNYVQKQMGTAEDPVRKLAEQGITHKPALLDEYLHDPLTGEQMRRAENVREQRREAGFPEEGLGQSPAAKAWEQASDESIAAHRAGDIQEMPEKFAKFTEAENKMRAARSELDKKFKQHIAVAGLNEREEANLIRGTAFDVKAKMVGDTDYAKANTEYLKAHVPMMDNYMELGRQNPYINKLAPDTPMYAPFTGDLGFDHIMDVLREDVTAGRIRPEQLNKVSMEQAVRRTFEYDQELAAKANASRAAAREGLPTYREYPKGYKWIELNKPGAFSQESEAMGHSVRGYEPPKGHPDWTEASGDAGSPSYGHGGWEAIKSGKAKVYSLVDPKGAPHATVEVSKADPIQAYIEKQPLEVQNEFKKRFDNWVYNIDYRPSPEEIRSHTQYLFDDMGISTPSQITQIKGKGNRAPNEEYLPYIQDFVRSGKWSDVGDLRHTGLSNVGGRYFTEPELVEAATKYGRMGVQDTPWEVARQRHIDAGVPEEQALENWVEGFRDGRGRLDIPPEGMAHGGVVRMGLGGAAKEVVEAGIKGVKKLLGAADEVPKGVLPVAERDANLAKMLEGSKVKERLYHGTNSDIASFDKDKVGGTFGADKKGFFFSSDPKIASEYADFAASNSAKKEGANVMPAHVNLKNPLTFDGLSKANTGIRLKPRHGNDSNSLTRLFDEERDSLLKFAKQFDNDGVHLKKDGNSLVVAFEPNQIKSATGNRGTYDTTDPDISKAAGGAIHMAGGGAIKAALAKLGKFATESDLAAIKEAGRAAYEQEASIRAAKNADVEKKLQSMPPRSKAANMEMGIYHPVGGGLKLSKPFEAMHSTRVANPKVVVPKVKILTPEDLYRQRVGFFPLVGDKADTGTFLTHIGEKELEVPVGLGGGPRYMDANLNLTNPSESSAWESGTGRTTALGGQAAKAAESGNPVYGVYTAGSGTNTDFNIMGANALLQQLNQSKLTKKAEKAFDKAMREEGTEAFPPMPDWPGIRSAQLEDMLLDKSNGILRTKLFDTMGKENFQSMGFPDIPATRKAIMDPQLHNTPTNEAGFRIAKMDPTGRIIENPLNPSDYPTAMAGELEGQLNMGMDYKDLFSTHFTNRRLLSKPESGDYYSFSRAHPIQYADQEWLDKIMKAQQAKDKLIKTGSYAKGGKVKPKGGLAAATKSSHRND
jgi:hypothetical protein